MTAVVGRIRSRISETRKISYTVEVTIAIGHHACHICGKESPVPTDDILVARARQMGNGDATVLWPGFGSWEWVPPGWSRMYVHGDSQDACDECTKKMLAAQAPKDVK